MAAEVAQMAPDFTLQADDRPTVAPEVYPRREPVVLAGLDRAL